MKPWPQISEQLYGLLNHSFWPFWRVYVHFHKSTHEALWKPLTCLLLRCSLESGWFTLFKLQCHGQYPEWGWCDKSCLYNKTNCTLWASEAGLMDEDCFLMFFISAASEWAFLPRCWRSAALPLPRLSCGDSVYHHAFSMWVSLLCCSVFLIHG